VAQVVTGHYCVAVHSLRLLVSRRVMGVLLFLLLCRRLLLLLLLLVLLCLPVLLVLLLHVARLLLVAVLDALFDVVASVIAGEEVAEVL